MLIFALLSVAFANPQYPFTIQDEVGSPCTPECVLCHATAAGGEDTVVQPFGIAMVERGLTGNEGLIEALEAFEEEALDQDGDGVTDIDELEEGENPNEVGETFCEIPSPEYGCFSHAPVPGGVAGLGIALLAVASGRKRRAISGS